MFSISNTNCEYKGLTGDVYRRSPLLGSDYTTFLPFEMITMSDQVIKVPSETDQRLNSDQS